MRVVIDLAERRRRRPVSRTLQAAINRRAHQIAMTEAARRYHLLRHDLLADVSEGVVHADQIDTWHPGIAP